MATRFDHINDAVAGDPPSASDQNSRAEVLSSQLNIAPLGIGVFPLPTVNSFKVTASTGLSVSIAAGSGIVQHSTIGYVAMAKGTSTTLSSLTDDAAEIYIFASVEDATNKTYESGLPLFIADDIDSMDGGLLLAKVTTAAGAVTGVVDLRHAIAPLNYVGAYVATRPHQTRDVVTHGGVWWIAIAPSTGVTPTEGASWTSLGGSTASHNHTSTAGDGGALTNDEHDGFSEYANIATPGTPAAGKVRIYAKTGGGFYVLDENGVEIDVTDIAGGRISIDVGGSSDYTLSAGQRGRRTIVFTGVLTGNINVIVSNANRFWQFVNITTGAFTLTVKPAAGTGVEIPQGASRLLGADGTNIVPLIQDEDVPATIARLASPALTGVPTAPTAAPGTNTTQIASTAFVTAAVAGGGGGTSYGWVPLQTITGTAQATWNFTSIVQTYKSLRFVGRMRGTTSGTGSTDIWMRFNNYSGADYNYFNISASVNGTANAAKTTGSTMVYINAAPNNSTIAQLFTEFEVVLHNYSKADNAKIFFIETYNPYVIHNISIKGHLTPNAEAISSVLFHSNSSGNFSALSSITMWGLKES